MPHLTCTIPKLATFYRANESLKRRGHEIYGWVFPFSFYFYEGDDVLNFFYKRHRTTASLLPKLMKMTLITVIAQITFEEIRLLFNDIYNH